MILNIISYLGLADLTSDEEDNEKFVRDPTKIISKIDDIKEHIEFKDLDFNSIFVNKKKEPNTLRQHHQHRHSFTTTTSISTKIIHQTLNFNTDQPSHNKNYPVASACKLNKNNINENVTCCQNVEILKLSKCQNSLKSLT